jgi:glutamyl-tRNA synthetase
VVDDIDMAITHVARGDDHLSNTPKHILLFRAFGVEPPVFAHLPLILGPDRKRLSKRTGATSVEEYRDIGILPQALFNFLTLLGWSPGGDREIFNKTEAASMFDLSQVHKAPAVFDAEKLLWMNGQYLIQMSPEQIYPYLEPFLKKPAPKYEVLALIELHQKRARTLREMAEQMEYYFVDDASVEYESEAVRKHLKGDELSDRLRALRDVLSSVQPFDVVATEAVLRKVAEQQSVGAGKLIHPLRLALTGRAVSPPVFNVAAVLGRERTLRRLERLIDQLPALSEL